jgi:hypothetical protein
LVPGPSLPVRLAALVVAVLVAGRFGAADEEMAAVWALAVGLASALAALVIDLGVVRITPGVGVRLRPPMTSVAALLPVVAAVPVAYAIGWIMGGS